MTPFEQFVNTPIVVTVVGIFISTALTVSGLVIGLFVRVANIQSIMSELAKDVQTLTDDKDVMRWSEWGRVHESQTPASRN